MLRRFSVNFAIISIVLDILWIALSLGAVTLIRPWLSSIPMVREIPAPLVTPWVLYFLFPLIWVSVFLILSVYDGRKNLRWMDELASLTVGSGLATISMAGILYLSYRDVSRLLFLLFVILAYGLMLLWRILARLAAQKGMLSPATSRRVLIIGAGKVGRRLREQIRTRAFSGLTLVGFLDDDLAKQAQQPEILGTLNQVREIVNGQVIDDVVIALPLSAYNQLNQMVSELHDLPVKVWIIPDYFSLALHHARVEEFADIPMLDLRAPALSEYQRLVKRAFDLVFTLLGMPVLLPLMGIFTLAVRLDSPGPALYRQKRVGENGKLFEMIKFRTMVQNAEELRHLVEQVSADGAILQNKTPSDPRITRVGRFLRRFSLDELPNLINVIRGEMSLVGPRPELPYLVEKYELWQRKRFAVPQGMTGWWQVNGRSDKPMHLHTEEDLYYVQHYSLWLDLEILIRTIWVVLRGKGAY